MTDLEQRIKEAQREYQRQWRAKNRRYWEKKAREAMEKEGNL